METIRMRVTWEFAVRGLIGVLRNPNAPIDSVQFAETELIRLARGMDSENERREGMPLQPIRADAPPSDADPATGATYGDLT